MRLFRNKSYILLSMLALIAVIAWASYGIINSNKEDTRYNVSVIVSNSNSNRWTSLGEGLEQAASDDNIRINFVKSSSIIHSAKEQKDLIDRELESGVDGIILEPYSSQDVSGIISDMASRAAVVLLDTDVEPEGIYMAVMPDNTAIGEAIGQSIKNDLGNALSGKRIGILCGNLDKNSMRDRLKGLNNSLEETGIIIEWTIHDEIDVGKKLAQAQEEKPVDIIAALGNDETETAIDYILSVGSKEPAVMLYGEGCSEKLVYYLDKGTIQALIVPNEFNMGYLSLEAIKKLLRYKEFSDENPQIEFLVINKDNLYDEENQKVLFPIVQ